MFLQHQGVTKCTCIAAFLARVCWHLYLTVAQARGIVLRFSVQTHDRGEDVRSRGLGATMFEQLLLDVDVAQMSFA